MRIFPRLHYAWVISGVAILAVFCCLGLARFAFGMMLPGMAQDLGLDYSQQGLLGTGYFVGYLLTVATLPYLAPRLGARRIVSAGLLTITLALAGFSLSSDFVVLTILYLIAGIGSGGAFVPVMSLASHWFHPSHRGRAAGIFLAGAGLGIIVSGFVVPRLEPLFGFTDWQVGWLIFSCLSLVLALLTAVLLRNNPAELGLEPYGRPGPLASGSDGPADTRGFRSIVLHMGAIYAIYGATYMVYATFIVTTMEQDFTFSRDHAGQVWAWIGFFSIFSGALFGFLSDHLGRRNGMIIAFGVLGLAYFLVSMNFGLAGLYISIALFGFAAWSIPTIISAAAGDYLGIQAAASGLAVITLMFAIGQSLGPVGGGIVAELTGDFTMAYGISAALCVLAITLCLWLRPPSHG
ncbi:MAG: MFS transporter [Alphaproteobacteria bacterium]|jgi:predicted MFS family arabinose efflux permease|nr:MFS transporter [Alphaproteobacteria bacterium]MBT4017226.1 MFS transporter [Alphaproteobacteria bacterium]MBT5161568.1 MFS transporter [Alphaproteobacteria bacterium]